MSDITMLTSGFYTSIQDMGRFGYADQGVPQSGVMDSFSARKANLLVDNPEDTAVLEITMTGPKIRFESPTAIAICGAGFDLDLDGKSIENAKVYSVKAGTELRFGKLIKGLRAYLAFKGGLDFPTVLGSKSMFGGITERFRIKKGDQLKLQSLSSANYAMRSKVRFRESDVFSKTIEVTPGPEYGLLKEEQKSVLTTAPFTLSPSGNRMAIPFNEKIPNQLGNLLTGPVLPGTVQLTPAGALIVLMRDCQVSGGYPRVLQLTEAGLNRLSQIAPGGSAFFKLLGI